VAAALVSWLSGGATPQAPSPKPQVSASAKNSFFTIISLRDQALGKATRSRSPERHAVASLNIDDMTYLPGDHRIATIASNYGAIHRGFDSS
jgi:hypothetical protein